MILVQTMSIIQFILQWDKISISQNTTYKMSYDFKRKYEWMEFWCDSDIYLFVYIINCKLWTDATI